jgi:hypothetical protein
MPTEELLADLCLRLRLRRTELEEEILARIDAVPDPSPISDPEYREGVRVTVSAAVEFGISTFESDEEHIAPIPDTLLVQARLAARSGVRLDSVLRRYLAGHTLLGNFVIEEAANGPEISLKRVLQTQASTFDAVLTAVSEEYRRERERRFRSRDERLADQVKRVLAGEPIETSELAYDFDGWHLAIIVGGGSTEAVRQLSHDLNCRLLAIDPGDGRGWAWLGSNERIDPARLREATAKGPCASLHLAFGESATGIGGWRLSHRQAKAALLVRRRTMLRHVYYADVALLAATLQDDLLVASLQQMYIRPLETGRDDGEVARSTLRAYFDSERNVSSAAAILQVSRRTVATRLRSIEERLGRPLSRAWAELEVALRIADLQSTAVTPPDRYSRFESAR